MDSTILEILALGAVGLAIVGVLQYINLRSPKTSDDERKAERCSPSASLL